MPSVDRSLQGLPGSSPSMAALVQASVPSLLTIASLFIACVAFHEPIDGAYLLLALLVFSLTFPGHIPPPGTAFLEIAGGVLTQWLAIVLMLLTLGWATHTLGFFDTHVMLVWIVAAPVAVAATQLWLPVILSRVMATEGLQRVAVIAGGGDLACRLERSIGQSPCLGIRVAGCFDDRTPARLNGGTPSDMLGRLGELAAYVRQNHVDLIYINMPMTSQPRIIKLLDDLRDTTASIYFVPDIFLFDLIQARLDTVGGIPVLAVRESPFYGINGLIKRASDIVLATAILILIAPLMLAIGFAIKRTSPGPVFFKQRRYGLDGREIIVYKFRSMTVCEDGGEIRQATQNDSRVTRLGAFLRASSLDELPQFVNVLQGRMSVVGPRPHAVAHNEMYRKLIDGYAIRHKVRPGITGLAQVNGQRGETDTIDKMQARIDYDLAYLRNWSLGLDLQIILKTLLVVWRKQNAY
jgi:putative colanic acid biosynthesis UDP-glucose lipid carrier transferase